QPAAEVAGEVVTAAQCREILRALDLLGVGAAPTGGCVQIAIGNPADGRLITVATRSRLRRAAGHRRRTRNRHRTRHGSKAGTAGAATPTTGPATGRETQLTDRPANGPGLGPPAPTTAYRPTAGQRRFLHVRDRHCRMPGCRRRAARCDIDHATAHAHGGPTDCWNLCCLCRRHHRIKTSARGWAFTLLPDGQLAVRTPSGVSRTTRP
ncbi:HNH endonuclease signature motif containing protein, partial [Blastococcus sp. MG754426]|uniref:HNH endonuclease signature motif containing protein n=1 Tax=Blastococcus sp. MG754426 TaxID=2570317 RepID=UPI001F3E394A